MKLSCTQENLQQGLSIVGRTVSSDNALPVLSNVLLKTKKGSLQLSATDLEIGVTCIVRCKVEEEGSITIPARLLTEYITSLPEGNVEIELKKNNLHLSLGEYKANIKGVDAEEFPLIPRVKQEPQIEVSAEALREAILRVVFAATPDESRPEIAGVLMSQKKDKLVLVATDSYRLAEKKIRDAEFASKIEDIILPAKTLQELARAFEGVTGAVKIAIAENQALFSANGIELVSRLVEGQYPDYKQIIPTSHQTSVIADSKELLKATQITSLFSRTGANDIKIEFLPDKNELVLKAISDQIGDNVSRIKAKITGKKGSIVFNYRYLIDGISNMGNGNVVFEIGMESSPSLLKPEEATDYVYVIMPIKQ